MGGGSEAASWFHIRVAFVVGSGRSLAGAGFLIFIRIFDFVKDFLFFGAENLFFRGCCAEKARRGRLLS